MPWNRFYVVALAVGLVAVTSFGQAASQDGQASGVNAQPSGQAELTVPKESPNPDDYDVIEPAKWRTVSLSMDLSHGGRCDITLLRPLPWIAFTSAEVGGTIDLQMPEMGIAGPAKVVAIEACPPIKANDDKPLPAGKVARPVIGKFVTTNAKVIELSIDGMDKPIGTTASHPFWSLDRKGWVAAGDLKPGEKLRTVDGSATVNSVVPRPGTETVYNLEVHKDHTFFVSEAKLWVHNTCTVLQTGGRVINEATRKALGLTREQAHKAMEALKKEMQRGGANHSHKIWSNGNVTDSNTGELLGNLFDFL